jgi:BMFP domain-containing protein YqiC
MGLEKKAKEVLEELVETGKKEAGPAEEGLPPEKKARNKLVDEAVSAFKELLEFIGECKGRLERGVGDTAESVAERLNVATRSDLDTVKEMARVAREKVDKLEKKLKELEKKEKKRP